MIFFNVEKVRQFLMHNEFVFTLRKPRKRTGIETLAYGNRFKGDITTLGKCYVYLAKANVIDPSQLWRFFKYSGLDTGLNTASQWLEKAKKMSGNKLNLYIVILKGAGD
jgi:hypothetical protein